MFPIICRKPKMTVLSQMVTSLFVKYHPLTSRGKNACFDLGFRRGGRVCYVRGKESSWLL